MITSMTGFGRSTKRIKEGTLVSEVRSLNSKFSDIIVKIPTNNIEHEIEVKELIKNKVSRGKVIVSIFLEKNENQDLKTSFDKNTVAKYYKLLTDIKKATKIKEEIKLEHILRFSEVLNQSDTFNIEKYWETAIIVYKNAIDNFIAMKKKEGKTLESDIKARIKTISTMLQKIEKVSHNNLAENKLRMKEKISSFLDEKIALETGRLEYELGLLADKLDVTEEIVRANSHLKYFISTMNEKENNGRKLNFLTQEINREVNTMGSKSNNSMISQYVVEIKEELEKIREQLQNIE
jgi:uncharacterized protein (TIGR00255 family)